MYEIERMWCKFNTFFFHISIVVTPCHKRHIDHWLFFERQFVFFIKCEYVLLFYFWTLYPLHRRWLWYILSRANFVPWNFVNKVKFRIRRSYCGGDVTRYEFRVNLVCSNGSNARLKVKSSAPFILTPLKIWLTRSKITKISFLRVLYTRQYRNNWSIIHIWASIIY